MTTDYHLQILSWRGMTWGARHFYGTVRADDYSFKQTVERELTEEVARELSEPDFEYEAGGFTEKFDDYESLITAAVQLWRDLKLGGNLYLGLPYEDDREILAS